MNCCGPVTVKVKSGGVLERDRRWLLEVAVLAPPWASDLRGSDSMGSVKGHLQVPPAAPRASPVLEVSQHLLEPIWATGQVCPRRVSYRAHGHACHAPTIVHRLQPRAGCQNGLLVLCSTPNLSDSATTGVEHATPPCLPP